MEYDVTQNKKREKVFGGYLSASISPSISQRKDNYFRTFSQRRINSIPSTVKNYRIKRACNVTFWIILNADRDLSTGRFQRFTAG